MNISQYVHLENFFIYKSYKFKGQLPWIKFARPNLGFCYKAGAVWPRWNSALFAFWCMAADQIIHMDKFMLI